MFNIASGLVQEEILSPDTNNMLICERGNYYPDSKGCQAPQAHRAHQAQDWSGSKILGVIRQYGHSVTKMWFTAHEKVPEWFTNTASLAHPIRYLSRFDH